MKKKFSWFDGIIESTKDALLATRRAFDTTKEEMATSLVFVIILTLVLAYIFYKVESVAQPDVFDSYLDAFVWAYSRYIEGGDGVFDGSPVTVVGKIIASLFGFIGIAIVAIPAGLIGSGYIDAMAEGKREKELLFYKKLIWKKFTRNTPQKVLDYIKKNPSKGAWYNGVDFKAVVDNISASDLLIHGIEFKDIIDVCRHFPGFRVVNEADAKSFAQKECTDRYLIEHFPVNRHYGFFIDRESNVTIVSPKSKSSIGNGNFSYYLAKFAGFNYMSKDFDVSEYSPENFAANRWEEPMHDGKTLAEREKIEYVSKKLRKEYAMKKELRELFLSDLRGLCKRENAWVIMFESFVKEDDSKPDVCLVHTMENRSGDTVQNLNLYNAILGNLQKELLTNFSCNVVDGGQGWLEKRGDGYRSIFYKLREDERECNCFKLLVSKDILLFNSDRRAIQFVIAKVIKDAVSSRKKLLDNEIEDMNRLNCWGYSENREQEVNEVKSYLQECRKIEQ